jgi:hypothetical protein
VPSSLVLHVALQYLALSALPILDSCACHCRRSTGTCCLHIAFSILCPLCRWRIFTTNILARGTLTNCHTTAT